MGERVWQGKAMALDVDTLARIVSNAQRRDTSGVFWPGCRGCDHVYMHADNCNFYLEAKCTTS